MKYMFIRGGEPIQVRPLSVCQLRRSVKAATVSDSRPETYSLYYLLYFFFRLTTVVPIAAPPLMSRSAVHKTRLLLSPVFGGVVFPELLV